MKIRLAETKDIKQILPLFIELDVKHSNNNTDLRTVIPKERYRNIFQDVFKSNSNLILIVVEIEEKIVAFALGKIIKIQNNLLLKDQIVGEILYFAVDVNFQRKGIARVLMHDIEERLKSRGADKLELRIFSFNNEPIPEKINYKPKYTVYEKH
ncbi:GNAT family N-acetyltransferase [Flavobacterium sp. FlaQc-47]|uniref:GNAT family N-acetyltransferase n=1 Tax=Flavobacterium sp. FlaQc-47 TaxID=3374180 RepID=UPI003756F800